MGCTGCERVQPIEDVGEIILTLPTEGRSQNIAEKVQHSGFLQQDSDRVYYLNYQSKEQLLKVVTDLGSLEKEYPLEKINIELNYPTESPGWNKTKLPFSQFWSRLHHDNMVHIIHNAAFTSYMQPIVNGNQVYGYEFVLRPAANSANFHPAQLFQTAQTTGLHSFLDRQARITAIETSARYLQQGIKRFINFLPSSIYNPNYCLTHTFKAINELALDPADFVFEVVETEQIDDIHHLNAIFEVYRKNGVKVALDDVGSGFATTIVMSELKPNYVKIDRSLIDQCDQHEDKQQKIKEIVDIANDFGGIVLAEGIEREEEWQCTKQLGVSLAQGYYFGKPAPEPTSFFTS